MIRGPQNQTAVTGSAVIFQCKVSGDPIPDVLWRRSANGGNMPLGRVHILEDRSLKIDNITMEDGKISQHNEYWEKFFNINLILGGEYYCEADNAVGTVSSSGMLVVYGRCLKNQINFWINIY